MALSANRQRTSLEEHDIPRKHQRQQRTSFKIDPHSQTPTAQYGVKPHINLLSKETSFVHWVVQGTLHKEASSL